MNIMDYLVSDKNTLVWFCFTVYAVTALFILPNSAKVNFQTVTADTSDKDQLRFASRIILRIALIFPMLFLLKNSL